MAMGGENYQIQCLSTILISEFTTNPQKVDIKQFFLFCTVVSGLNIIYCPLMQGGKKKKKSPPHPTENIN